MVAPSVVLGGKEYVIVERAEFERLRDLRDDDLPRFPPEDRKGNMPAIEFGRVLLARRLVTARKQAGLSQRELARQSGVRIETINRIERARQNATEATWVKIERALKRRGVSV